MPTRTSQESNLGLQQMRMVFSQLYWDQAETQPERATFQPSCFYPPVPSDRHKLVHGFGLFRICLFIYIYPLQICKQTNCGRQTNNNTTNSGNKICRRDLSLHCSSGLYMKLYRKNMFTDFTERTCQEFRVILRLQYVKCKVCFMLILVSCARAFHYHRQNFL